MITWVVRLRNGMLQLLFDPCDVGHCHSTAYTFYSFFTHFLLTSFLTFDSLLTHFVPHFLLTFFAGTFSMQLFLFIKIHHGSMRCAFIHE